MTEKPENRMDRPGAWDDPQQCAHIVSSDIDNDGWETAPGMPEPSPIRSAIESTVR